MNVSRLTRPVLRWHGGKWRLAPWIIAHFSPHRIYSELFGGAASVLLRKPRAYAEIYNDLDGEVVNLFRVLRNGAHAERLIELLRLTPFARAEFLAAYELADDPVERARRLIARSFMGYGSGPVFYRSSGFRANANATGAHNTAAEWAGYPDALAAVVDRMQGVAIEEADAFDLIARADSPATLHYIDPPYLAETRSRGNPYRAKHKYRHELNDGDHARLLELARGLRGMVVISGYASALYDRALADWRRVEKPALADGARQRMEVLWINPAAWAALDARGAA
jgi:DNA adenine methylase